ncbi:LamG-like jellyroll fold domain-containing protein [Dactylosporangium sp. NPDC050588]|uniref:LamG-like jellyroll fold domain-containing protein n=1 Tax=Dactylosporangium sp. NPDC050588 TaxID=3157211 RepID=UPI0033F1ADEB
MSEAKVTNKPVEITQRRTETTEFFINPSGTYTMKQFAAPVRVQQDGKWSDIDLTLIRDAKGVVRPKASSVDVSFSGGGKGDLLTLKGIGGTFALTWPTELPKPRLEGANAVYPDLLPGVDLQLTAQREGFSKVFVVKNRAAAGSQALRKLTFGVRTADLKITSAVDGGFNLVDRNGTSVLISDAPIMWDEPVIPAGLSKWEAELVEPAHHATMRSVIGEDQLSVEPDQAMLARTDLNFPVYIDPSGTVTNNGNWTHINQANGNTSYWTTDRDRAKVGYSGYATTKTPWRSYFLFGVENLVGKQLTNAVFSINLDHSASCGDTPVMLYGTNNVSSAGSVTWNNSSGSNIWATHIATGWGHANEDTGCGGQAAPDMTMWMGGYDYPLVRQHMQRAANGEFGGQITFGLKAVDEGQKLQWKQFHPWGAALSIEYNTTPDVPQELNTVPATTCGSESRPTRLPAAMQQTKFSALLLDSDANTVHGDLQVLQGATETVKHAASTVGVANGSAVSWPAVPAGVLQANTVYSYRARSGDGIGTSPWSSRCFFIIDTTGPSVPTISSTDFPDGDPVKDVGQTGSVLFKHAPADTDIAGYAYGFAADKLTGWVPANSTGDATIPVTLWTDPDTGYASSDLYVRSEDFAGNQSVTTANPYQLMANDNGAVPPKKRGDVNGDGKGDISAIIDAGGDRLRAWTLTSNGLDVDNNLDFSTQTVGWDTGRDGSSFVTMRFVTGDFTGPSGAPDGLSDHALFRQDPDGLIRMFLLTARGNRFDILQDPVWTSPAAPVDPLWNIANLRFVPGDFDGDGKADVAAVRGDLTGTGSTIWVWKQSSGSAQYTATQWASTPAINITTATPVGADLDADGDTDITFMKADAVDSMSALVYKSNGAAQTFQTPSGPAWSSGAGNFEYRRARFVAGNFDGDTTNGKGKIDIAVLYDYGTSSNLAVWGWNGTAITSLSVSPTWTSFDVRKVKELQASDFDGDGKDDLAIFRDSSIVGTTELHTVRNSGTGFTAAPLMVRSWTVSEKPERRAAWRFDDTGSGTAVFDEYGDYPAKIFAGGTRVNGRKFSTDPSDRALSLNGTNQWAATSGAVVRTDRTFTVAAWVRVTATNSWQTVVGSQGTWQSGFYLQCTIDGQWRFVFANTDVASPTGYSLAQGKTLAQANTWTHIAGVYDGDTGTIKIYVNGVLEGTSIRATPWNAWGPIQIGRAEGRLGGGSNYVGGTIDNVDIFDHAASSYEIAQLATP